MDNITYLPHIQKADWLVDSAPPTAIVSDQESYSLLPSDMALWYIIRLDVMFWNCEEAGKFVLRPGVAIMSMDRPIKFNSTVVLSHMQTPALGSVCMISEDRRFLEEQMKILEQQQHQAASGRAHPPPPAELPLASTSTSGASGGGGARYGESGGGGGGAGAEGSDASGTGAGADYSHSGSDWDPDVHTSTDSDHESKRRCLPKYGRNRRPTTKPRGPSLRAELPLMRSTAGMRSFSRLSIDNQSQYKFNVLRASDFPVYNQSIHENGGPIANMPTSSIMTFDQQSQTEETGEETNTLTGNVAVLQGEVQRLNQIVSEMQAKMDCMKNALGLHNDPFDSNYGVREEVVASEPTVRSNPTLIVNTPNTRAGQRTNVLLEMNRNVAHDAKRRRTYNRAPSHEERNTSNSYGSDADAEYPDMVPIGSGKTLIPKHIYTQIDWNSYTIATRKLLMAVFPRRTLATHSLTGKASPAFMSKPAKLRLDMKKVSDIVMTVVENCAVREGLVRSCITTKCADENKMYRMRLKKKASKNKKAAEDPGVINQENTPPHAGRNSDLQPPAAVQYANTPANTQYAPHHTTRQV